VILSLQMSPGSSILQTWMHRRPAAVTVKFETTAGRNIEVHRDWAPPFFGEGKNLLRRTRLAKICGRHLDLDATRRAHFSAQFRTPLPPSRREHEMGASAASSSATTRARKRPGAARGTGRPGDRAGHDPGEPAGGDRTVGLHSYAVERYAAVRPPEWRSGRPLLCAVCIGGDAQAHP
jgi:hypothetical protein